jgi:hypothetical protein
VLGPPAWQVTTMTEPLRKPKLILNCPEPRRPSGVVPRTLLPAVDLSWIRRLHRLWRFAGRAPVNRR